MKLLKDIWYEVRPVIGLFLPVQRDTQGQSAYSIQVGFIPLGWVMVLVAAVVSLIL